MQRQFGREKINLFTKEAGMTGEPYVKKPNPSNKTLDL